MQIHELNRPRRTDEGVLGAIGTALGQAVSPGAGTTQDFRAASAGITDPTKKLAAVMREPAMVKLATQYADAWLKDPRSQVSAAPVTSAPAPTPPGETPEQKRIRLQKAAQQNIDKTATPVAQATAQPATTSPADIRQAKQGQAAKNAQAQMSAVKEAVAAVKSKDDISKFSPQAQQQITQARQQPVAPATAATQTPPAANKTSPVTTQGFNASNVMKMPGMEKSKTAPASAQTANFAQQGAGYKAVNQPTAVKYSGVPGAKTAATNTAPATATNTAPPATDTNTAPPADPEYIKNFLKFANEKIAMRDPTTYKMIGLADVENAKNGLKSQLDAAKQEVKTTQGDPAATKTAVKNYILTAMAGAQLVATASKAAAATSQAPAYGQQPAAGATGAAAGTAPATDQLTGSGAVKLLTDAGLPEATLTKAGQAIQTVTGNKQLSTSGDSVIDTMLQGMGYTVS